MKKSVLLPVLFLLVCARAAFAQNPVLNNTNNYGKVVEGHYGKAGQDVAYGAAATSDGGYIITGLTTSVVPNSDEIVVIKIGPQGDSTWSRIYSGPLLTGGNCIIQTSDGGYMVAGHTEDWGSNDCDAYEMKLDQNGNMLWENHYGGDSDDIAKCVLQLGTSGYILGGYTFSYGNVDTNQTSHVYIIRTNNTGDTLWTRVYAGAKSDECYSIINMADGGFLAAGWSNSFGNGEDDGWLLRMNANGDTLWTRLYKAPGDTRLNKVLPTIDNGYILAGSTTPAAGDYSQGLIVKLDANGNPQWQKSYGDTAANITFQSVVQLPTGNYIFAGSIYATPTTNNVYLLTTDANGTMQMDEVCGGTDSWANEIVAQGNNSYLIAGATAQYGDPDGDVYYREMNNTLPASVAIVSMEGPQLYPNPVMNQPAIIILPAAEANEAVHFEVMTSGGQVIVNNNSTLAKDIVINRDDFAAGMYIFKVTCSDGKVYKGKFVVE